MTLDREEVAQLLYKGYCIAMGQIFDWRQMEKNVVLSGYWYRQADEWIAARGKKA